MNDMIVKTVENFFLSVLFGFIRSLLIIKDTVDPPASDHSKFQALLVAYGRWWLTRAWTILGQNFASLAYSNFEARVF